MTVYIVNLFLISIGSILLLSGIAFSTGLLISCMSSRIKKLNKK